VWHHYTSSAPALSQVALALPSVTASEAAVEPTLSAHGQIPSDIRNDYRLSDSSELSNPSCSFVGTLEPSNSSSILPVTDIPIEIDKDYDPADEEVEEPIEPVWKHKHHWMMHGATTVMRRCMT